MELITEKFGAGVIEFNNEELKIKLKDYASQYTGLIVTEDNEKEMIGVKNELTKVQKLVDDFRKSNKKEMEKPIKEFEEKCKELQKIVAEVLEPVKDQLNVFEDNRREERRKNIIAIIEKIGEEYNLPVEWSSQVKMEDKYLNKTAKKNDVIEDIKKQYENLLACFKNETALAELRKQKIDLIQSCVETTNNKYNLQMKISQFSALENSELSDIPRSIEEKGKEIYDYRTLEAKRKLEIEEAKKLNEEVTEEKVQEEVKVVKKEKTYNFSLKITECPATKAKLIKEFLTENNIKFDLEGVVVND